MKQQEAIEELAFIRQVIEDSRGVVVYDGRPFIIWGILVAAGLTASHIMADQNTADITHVWIWLSIALCGWLWSWFDRRRTQSLSRAKTFAGRTLGAIWFASGIAITLVGVMAFLGAGISLYALPSLTAFILGIAYFTTGRLMRTTWVIALAGCWWTGGALLLFLPNRTLLLLYASMMLVFQVAPGVYLQRISRRKLTGNMG